MCFSPQREHLYGPCSSTVKSESRVYQNSPLLARCHAEVGLSIAECVPNLPQLHRLCSFLGIELPQAEGLTELGNCELLTRVGVPV